MAVLSYRVISPGGFYIADKYYPPNSTMILDEVGARYLLLSDVIVPISSDRTASPVIVAPLNVTETNSRITLTVDGKSRDVTLEELINLFPRMRGMPGTPGAPGPAGGPQGRPGPIGPAGSIGPRGLAGPPGDVIGVEGIPGQDGAPGAPGSTGEQGPQGEEGPQGPAGPNGLDGNPGTAGSQGPKGDRGEQGIQGEQGAATRIVGSVATPANLPVSGEMDELYLVQQDDTANPKTYRAGDGYVWTGTQFANIGPIRGPVGPQGPAGQNGLPGVDGLTGPQGLPGLQGSQGASGAPGIQGLQGIQGQQGPSGPQGAQGIPGISPVIDYDIIIAQIKPTIEDSLINYVDPRISSLIERLNALEDGSSQASNDGQLIALGFF